MYFGYLGNLEDYCSIDSSSWGAAREVKQLAVKCDHLPLWYFFYNMDGDGNKEIKGLKDCK